MIRVTLEHTDTLGPEADIPMLVGKIAERLTAADASVSDQHVFVCARTVSVFAGSAGDWETLVGRVTAPPEAARAFADGLLAELLGLAEAHLAELCAWRSVAISFELETPSQSISRLRPRPASAPGF